LTQVAVEQHSSVAEAIVRPHPSYSPEEKARQREISPTYSSDASNACTPRKGACPENPPSSFLAHAREEVLNDMVLAVVEEWDADYGIKIVYRREDVDDYRMPPARQSYFKPTGAGTSRYSTCDDLIFRLLRILSANARTLRCCQSHTHSNHFLARRWALQQVFGESGLAK
jgi:hypothetical protein